MSYPIESKQLGGPLPIEASLLSPINTNGAADAHTDFEVFSTPEVRSRVASAALELIRAAVPNINPEDVYISCFDAPYDNDAMDAADTFKLKVRSSVSAGGLSKFNELVDGEYYYDRNFAGDDSNEANVIERQIQMLRDKRTLINRELVDLYDTDKLTPSAKQSGVNRIAAVNSQIAELQSRKAKALLPIYYATPFEGLLNADGEDNPLGYAGDMPTTAYLAFYNGAAIKEAGMTVTEKSEQQLRIHARGRDIMRHCLAVMHVVFVEN